MREIKTWRDPYDVGFSTCRPRKIVINEGVTILVGCNGAGKTTLLKNIKEVLKKEKIPCLSYDNHSDGGTLSISELLYSNDIAGFGSMLMSSEGEQISQNISRVISELREFLRTGETKETKKNKRWRDMFRSDDEPEEEPEVIPERWILLDAVDSGYSVDNVIDLKGVFDLIIEDAKNYGVTVYIVASANEYELAAGEQCFDVNTGKYLTFRNYNSYKKFILKSREKKEKRYEKIRKETKE